jgi:membrane fusion protein (multidrug efflux system)
MALQAHQPTRRRVPPSQVPPPFLSVLVDLAAWLEGARLAPSAGMSLRIHSLFVAIALAAAVVACTRSAAAPPAPPPTTVGVIEVAPETVPVSTDWITTLDGFVNAQIHPQVSGYLVRRNYREGAGVRKGEVLFEIDQRPFQVALQQAQAQLARAQAELGRSERDVQRDTPLATERAIAQSQLDNDIQGHLAAQAAVQAATAAVDAAQLNLDFTHVRSLIDGVAAIATAQIGDLVGPQTLLTTVSQIDPIRAYFSLSEREYLLVASRINRGGRASTLWEGGDALHLRLADGSEYPRTGTFVAADRQIDPRTGTIRISASFPNPDHVLRPGQYGRVEATTQTVSNALLVPQRAVSELQGTSQLRVVDAQSKARIVNVTLGGRVGTRWIISKGLQPGARVIVDATQLRDGTPVQTRAVAADADAAPEAR